MTAMSAMEREWARLGALSRLQKLDEERASILKAFPELRRRASTLLTASGTHKPRRQFSAAARKRMSAGMRKYWARRRAAAKAAKA